MTTTPEQQDTRPHRLAREEFGTAERVGLSASVAIAGIPFALPVAVLAGGTDATTAWRIIIGSILVGIVGLIRRRRHLARARWMRDTPNWWERLDDAPTLLTFPRATRAVRRVVNWRRGGGRHAFE